MDHSNYWKMTVKIIIVAISENGLSVDYSYEAQQLILEMRVKVLIDDIG